MTDTPDGSSAERVVTPAYSGPDRRSVPRGCAICSKPNPAGTLTCGTPECRRELMHRQQHASYSRARSREYRTYMVLFEMEITRISLMEDLDTAG